MSDTNGWDVLRDALKLIFTWQTMVFGIAVMVGLGMADVGPLSQLMKELGELIRAAK